MFSYLKGWKVKIGIAARGFFEVFEMFSRSCLRGKYAAEIAQILNMIQDAQFFIDREILQGQPKKRFQLDPHHDRKTLQKQAGGHMFIFLGRVGVELKAYLAQENVNHHTWRSPQNA